MEYNTSSNFILTIKKKGVHKKVMLDKAFVVLLQTSFTRWGMVLNEKYIHTNVFQDFKRNKIPLTEESKKGFKVFFLIDSELPNWYKNHVHPQTIIHLNKLSIIAYFCIQLFLFHRLFQREWSEWSWTLRRQYQVLSIY